MVLSAWNLFVWVGRFRNLVQEPGPLLDANRWSLAGSIGFSVLALIVIAHLLIDVGSRRTWLVASILAVSGIVVWVYRVAVILGRDYDVGFVVVHTVLAAVTIGLGLLVLRVARSRFGLTSL